jgi:hypothetical protein
MHPPAVASVSASPSPSSSAPDVSAANTTLPDILSETEEGFADLVFGLQSLEIRSDGSALLRVKGRHGQTVVGFDVNLSGWSKRPASKQFPVDTFVGTVALISSGSAGDAFVRELESAYGTKLSPTSMASATPFSAMSLAGDPLGLDSGQLKLKLFFEPQNEKDYAEVYLNIDTQQKRVYLREKDPGYRSAIVRALSRRAQ